MNTMLFFSTPPYYWRLCMWSRKRGQKKCTLCTWGSMHFFSFVPSLISANLHKFNICEYNQYVVSFGYQSESHSKFSSFVPSLISATTHKFNIYGYNQEVVSFGYQSESHLVSIPKSNGTLLEKKWLKKIA